VAVETVMEFDNIETVKRAVEIEAGISIVPQATVAQEVAKQTLSNSGLKGGTLPSAGGHLQEDQGAFPGDEAVPADLEGVKAVPKPAAPRICKRKGKTAPGK